MSPAEPRHPKKLLRGKHRILLFLVALAAFSQSAYLILTGHQREPLSWNSERLPIQFQIWQGFTDALPGIVDGSQPKFAIREALNEWAQASAISMRLTETPRSRAGQDGINLITISDEPENWDFVASQLAVALVWGLPAQIQEADIVFNPQARDPWSTIEERHTFNIYDVAVHEFGHALGMEHSVARTSRMFFQGGGYTFGLRGLSYDDFAGVNLLYPLPGIDRITGSISGRVLRNGSPLFGAFVVATDEQGALAANSISGRDGSYRIERLPPGRYTLYAEPLDGPTTPLNLSGTMFDPVTDVVTDFPPAFYQNSVEPLVTVSEGITTSGINLNVSFGASGIEPALVGIASDPFGGVRVTSTPASGFQGSDTNFVGAGNDLDGLPAQGAFALLGMLSTPGNVVRTVSMSTVVFKFFPMTIPPTAPKGEYSAIFRNGSQLGVVTGGFHVFSSFRFMRPFGQFAHLPGAATSQLFLVNLDPDVASQGRVVANSSLDNFGVSLEGLPQSLSAPIDFQLPPAGAVLTRSVGSGEFRGGLVAEASRRLGAAVLVETAFGTTGLAPSWPTTSFVAPVEIAASGRVVDTGLALANLDERNVLIYLQVQDQGGRSAGQAIVELEPRGQLARFVRELVPGVPADFRGSVLATANRPIAATVIRTSPGVFTTLPVIQRRVNPQTVFPHFAQFGPLSSELVLVNPSPDCTASGVAVQVRDQNGNPAPVTLNGTFYPTGRVVLELPPLASASLRSSQTQVVGWVEVTSSLPVGGVLLYRSSEVGTAGVGRAELSPSQVLPLNRDVGNSTDLGIAIVNVETRPVTVTIQARDSNGAKVGPARILTLSRHQQVARFPNEGELDLNLPDQFTGSLELHADGRLGVTGICQSPGVLTTLPAFERRIPVTPADQ